MMTTTENTGTLLATVKAVDLHRVLGNTAVFASRDDTVPSINVVHIEYTSTHMLAVATDRFRLGVAKLDLLDDGITRTGDTFNVSPADVDRLIKMAKTLKRDEGHRHVWINRNDDDTVTFTFSDGASLNVKPTDIEFPKWRGLFPKTPGYPRSATAFTAEYLASFAKVDAGRSGTMVLYSHDDIHGRRDKPEKADGKPFGSQKPLTFTIGDNFIGLLMPVKLVDDAKREWHLPKWMA